MARVVSILSVLFLSCCVFSSCQDQVRKRPYGDLRIGAVKDLLAPQTFLPDMRFLVRHDAGGFSAMSTLCTHDLTPLSMKKSPDGAASIFVSQYSESQYQEDGTVIHGPAIANLPYYELQIDSGTLGGPKDTLYVKIGNEVSPQWRLPG